MLEKRAMEQREIPIKEVFVSAHYHLKVEEQVVRCHADHSSGAYTIILPPVALAKGLQYFILARDADALNTITIHDLDDSECWDGDVVFDAKCDGMIFESDGMKWWQCCQVNESAAPAESESSASRQPK